jgi:hypothetical protein
MGWPLAAATTAGAGALAKFGYSFGTGDHLVLMPKGLSLADPGAFAGDWFVHHAPQPHWFFDLVTFLGERLGVLPPIYLLWWLASLFAFGLGAVWLSRALLPGRMWPALLLGPVLAAGPDKVLGSTSPLLGVALPHMLGGCLAFAALAALLNRYWRAAVVCAVLAGLLHVQHGANLVPVLLLTAGLAAGAPRRSRLEITGAAAVLVAGAVAVGWWRQVATGGEGWLEVCEVAAPFHCDANSWTAPYLWSGALVVALALGLGIGYRQRWRLVLPVVGLPAVGLAVAVLADRLDIPVLGHLAQQTNAYRLAAQVVPFAAFALLAAAASAARSRGAVRLGVGLLVLGWVAGPDAAFHLGLEPFRPALLVPAVMVATVAGLLVWMGRETPALAAPTAVLLVLATVVAAQDGPYPVAVGYQRADPVVAASLRLGRLLPEAAVVAAPPALVSIRALTRRAVIADCKFVPYGGAPWSEYKARIAALGGHYCGSKFNTGFARISPGAVESLRDRFGATHVLLAGDDPKLDYARAHWKLLWRAEPAEPPLLQAGWWVFQLPPV